MLYIIGGAILIAITAAAFVIIGTVPMYVARYTFGIDPAWGILFWLVCLSAFLGLVAYRHDTFQ